MRDFPLGPAAGANCWRMVTAYMILIFTSAGFATCVFAGIAENVVNKETVEQTVERLAGQPIGYWLIALAMFCGTSFTMIVRWLLTQLQSQRESNKETTDKLISYLAGDRVRAIELLARATTVLEKTVETHESR